MEGGFMFTKGNRCTLELVVGWNAMEDPLDK